MIVAVHIDPKDVIVEIQQVGSALKVSAVDTRSLLEVSFVAPASTDRLSIDRLAVQKLTYAANRRARNA